MPELESRRLIAVIYDESGAPVGEARLWIAGDRGGAGWYGWLRGSDLGTPLAPGRYTFVSAEGWRAGFETGHAPPTRVFETELLPIRGAGDLPWYTAADIAEPTQS